MKNISEPKQLKLKGTEMITELIAIYALAATAFSPAIEDEFTPSVAKAIEFTVVEEEDLLIPLNELIEASGSGQVKAAYPISAGVEPVGTLERSGAGLSYTPKSVGVDRFEYVLVYERKIDGRVRYEASEPQTVTITVAQKQ